MICNKSQSSSNMSEINSASNAFSSFCNVISKLISSCKSTSWSKSSNSSNLSYSIRSSNIADISASITEGGAKPDVLCWDKIYREQDAMCLLNHPVLLFLYLRPQGQIQSVDRNEVESTTAGSGWVVLSLFFFFSATALRVSKPVRIPDAPDLLSRTFDSLSW